MRRFGIVLMKATLSLIAVTVLALGMGKSVNAAGAEYFQAYAKASYETKSSNFALTVEGEPVDVVTYFNGRYDYAHIAYEGTASFNIKSLKGSIEKSNVSPHSYNVDSSVSGDTLSFNLSQDGSRYLILEITSGGTKRILVIAADPRETIAKPEITGNNVDITKAPYKADATGAANVSAVLQKAIDDVSAAGGGTVYVPAGVYKFVYIDARDNVTLYLDKGAVLRGSDNRNDYIWDPTGANGRQGRRNVDLVDAENFAIVGRGMIDANSTVLVEPDKNGKITGWCNFRKGIIDGDGAKNITLDGITVKDATGWTFCIENSDNIICKNVKMLNDFDFVHSDGYDFVSCQGVLVEDCLGICGDDVYCPKASYEGREMKDYLFKNSVAYATGGAGCKVGMQARANTSNIEFNDIDVVRGYRGFSISHDDGSGDFSDIRFIDVRTEKLYIRSLTDNGQFRPAPFVIWTLQKNNSGATVSDIEVTNCSIEDTGTLKGIIQGSTNADSHINGVSFQNLSMNGTIVTDANYSQFVTHGSNASNIKYNNAEGNAVSYEAENGVLTGASKINDKDWASNGKTVGDLGLGASGLGSCEITVPSDKACDVNMTIYYATKGTRSFFVTVNNEAPVEVVCEGNDWNVLRSANVIIHLNQGNNVIKLTNESNPTPNLDNIVISHTVTTESFEAENGVLTGISKINDKDWASNGKTVGDLGLGESGLGCCEITVPSEASRDVKMTIYYATKGTRSFFVTANKGAPVEVVCEGNDWNTLQKVDTVIHLDKGNNVIKLTNESNPTPNLDRIVIMYAQTP